MILVLAQVLLVLTLVGTLDFGTSDSGLTIRFEYSKVFGFYFYVLVLHDAICHCIGESTFESAKINNLRGPMLLSDDLCVLMMQRVGCNRTESGPVSRGRESSSLHCSLSPFLAS